MRGDGEEQGGKESREILEQFTRYCPKPRPEWAKSHREEAARPTPDFLPGLSALSLPQTVLVTETYLEVKCNADHEVPEYCQESADQVFL